MLTITDQSPPTRVQFIPRILMISSHANLLAALKLHFYSFSFKDLPHWCSLQTRVGVRLPTINQRNMFHEIRLNDYFDWIIFRILFNIGKESVSTLQSQ